MEGTYEISRKFSRLFSNGIRIYVYQGNNEFTIIWGKLNMKRKIACVLLGAVSLQLLSCGQHGSNETLTEPNICASGI